MRKIEQVKYSKILTENPRPKEIPFKYNEDIVNILCDKLPHLRDIIKHCESIARKTRLFGSLKICDEKTEVQAIVQFKEGLILTAYLHSEIYMDIQDKRYLVGTMDRSILNPKVTFKNNKTITKAIK